MWCRTKPALHPRPGERQPPALRAVPRHRLPLHPMRFPCSPCRIPSVVEPWACADSVDPIDMIWSGLRRCFNLGYAPHRYFPANAERPEGESANVNARRTAEPAGDLPILRKLRQCIDLTPDEIADL